MLLLHVSDTHLGSSRPLTYSASREQDFYEVFDDVIEIAIRERVDAVLHCGDFFDDPEPSPRTYYHAIRSLRKLSEAGIPLLVVAGQHDRSRRAEVSPLKVLEEAGMVRVMALSKPETRVVRLRSGELGIAAVPYAPPDVVREWVKELRRPEAERRILMAHLLLKELGLPASHTSLPELDAASYSYVALGDYHRRYVTEVGGVPVVYPGSTEALDVTERSDERYAAIVDLSKREVSVSWATLSRFRRIVLIENVSSYTDLVRGVEKLGLPGRGKPPILYVRLGELKDPHGYDLKRMRDWLDGLVRRSAILTYRLTLPEVIEEEGPQEELEREEPPPTLEYVVYEVVRDPEVAELLIRIVRSGDDVEAVRRIVLETVANERLVGKIERLVGQK